MLSYCRTYLTHCQQVLIVKRRRLKLNNPAVTGRRITGPTYLTHSTNFYRRPARQCRAADCLVDIWWFRQRPEQTTVQRPLRQGPSQPQRLPNCRYVLRLARVDRLRPGSEPLCGWARDRLTHHLVSPGSCRTHQKKLNKPNHPESATNLILSWSLLLLLLLTTLLLYIVAHHTLIITPPHNVFQYFVRNISVTGVESTKKFAKERQQIIGWSGASRVHWCDIVMVSRFGWAWARRLILDFFFLFFL